MVNKIINSFYESIICDGRYKFIFEGLLNTLIIAFFAVIGEHVSDTDDILVVGLGNR